MDIGTPVTSSSCTAARAQEDAHERFQRAFPGKHRSAYQAGLPVRPRQQCSAKADSMACDGGLWHRSLSKNRFGGFVPSSISAMTALTSL
jgi:hypothetical protein